MNIVERVDQAIEDAQNNRSRLPVEAGQVEGMIGMHVRHLLNNLCSIPGTVYLEVGLYLGASFVAALSGNPFHHAYGIDNWDNTIEPSLRQGDKAKFLETISRFLGSAKDRFDIVDSDAMAVPHEWFDHAPNILYYDGDHSKTAQALSHLWPICDGTSIVLLDDWQLSDVRRDWLAFTSSPDVQVVHEWTLECSRRDTATWWCGFHIAIVERPADV